MKKVNSGKIVILGTFQALADETKGMKDNCQGNLETIFGVS